MLRNYLLITFRNLFRRRSGKFPVFTLINLGGLAIGLAAFVMIARFVQYELSYDRFYPDAENICRITVSKTENEETGFQSAKTYAGMARILKDELPEVEMAVRVLAEECMIHYRPERIKFNNQHTYWADAGFYRMFGLSMIEKGDLTQLDYPNHAIISRDAATRFFGTDWSGDRTPIGKTIWLNEGVPFMIQGVYNDLPANAHIQVDFIVSYATLTNLIGQVMENAMPPDGNFVYTYLLLKSGYAIQKVQRAVNNSLANKIPDSQKQVAEVYFNLQPVSSVHLQSNLSDELRPNGNKVVVYALGLAAIIILIIAWVNYINLATARAMDRAKEVGVRKAVGADKGQLFGQFVFESFFSGVLAAVVAILIVLAFDHSFRDMTGIHAPLFSGDDLSLWKLFAAVVLTGSLLSSIYPALVLTSFKPVKVLKGKIHATAQGGYFRKGLITFQFFTAVFLLCCTGAIYYQVDFMRSQPLGVEMEQALVVHTPKSMIGNAERAQYFKTFRNDLLSHASIHEIASSGCIPGKEFLYHRENVRQAGRETGKHIAYDLASVDEGYLPALGMNLVAGRNFSEHRPEAKSVIINEKAVSALGFADAETAVNQLIKISGNEEREIIGVVSDVHYKGLQKEIAPLLLVYGHDYEFGFFTLKVNTADIQQTVSLVKAQWDKVYPNDPFDYFFLNTFFDRQYKSEVAFGRVFSVFSGLGVLIACLGLFGLASFTAHQKTKEIGIRKVLGAATLQIVLMLAGNFFRFVLIAATLAIPFSHWIITRWLQTFAYRFEIGWWMYFLPVLLIAVVALLAVGGQSVKAAMGNPVKALKEE